MLFDTGRQSHPTDITIRSSTPGGFELVTRVPIKTLMAKECTLHKLAARAVLGDLERGQGWIHVCPSRLRPGSDEEQRAVRQEGESIGCKWSLVSKWTSFFAIEEPFVASEHDYDPFLDNENIETHVRTGDLDLLRPRGPAERRQELLIPAIDTESLEQSENDPDDAASSDSEDLGGTGSSSDSEGDDDGRRGGGSGATGSGGNNSASGQNGGNRMGSQMNNQGVRGDNQPQDDSTNNNTEGRRSRQRHGNRDAGAEDQRQEHNDSPESRSGTASRTRTNHQHRASESLLSEEIEGQRRQATHEVAYRDPQTEAALVRSLATQSPLSLSSRRSRADSSNFSTKGPGAGPARKKIRQSSAEDTTEDLRRTDPRPKFSYSGIDKLRNEKPKGE